MKYTLGLELVLFCFWRSIMFLMQLLMLLVSMKMMCQVANYQDGTQIRAIWAYKTREWAVVACNFGKIFWPQPLVLFHLQGVCTWYALCIIKLRICFTMKCWEFVAWQFNHMGTLHGNNIGAAEKCITSFFCTLQRPRIAN